MALIRYNKMDEKTEESEEATKDLKGTENKQVAPMATNSATGFLKHAEAEGFSGLDLTKSSFNSIILDSGVFCDAETKEELVITDDNGVELDCSKSFLINLVSSRVKHMINIIEAGAAKDDEGELHVQYEGDELDHRGDNVQQIILMAEEEGCEVRKSTYLEVIGAVLSEAEQGKEIDPDNVLDVVSLSIPPMSKSGLSGAITVYNRRNRKNPVTTPSEAIILCNVGKKRSTSGGKSYYPWKFTCVAKAVLDS